MCEDEAIAILESGQGTHFDPCLLRLFLSLLPEMRRVARETPDNLQSNGLREKLPRLALDMHAAEQTLQREHQQGSPDTADGSRSHG